MGIYKRITAILLCTVVVLAVLLPCAEPAVYGENAGRTTAKADSGTYIKLQSGNMLGYYVKDMMGVPSPDYDTVKIVDNVQDIECTMWKIVRGLAGAAEDMEDYVSFESVNFPGYYLRKSDKNNQLVFAELDQAADAEDFKRKATFLRESGLAPKEGETTYSFSLLGSEPPTYIRHSRYVIYLDSYLDSEGKINEGTQKDATFYMRESGGSENRVYQLEAAHYGKNYYLRHLAIPLKLTHQIKIAVWDGRYNTDWNDNGQWKIVSGLAADEEAYVSFESKIRPGCYLKKAENGDYIEVASLAEAEKSGKGEQFKMDATFLRENALIDPNTLTNKEVSDLAMPMKAEDWHSYSLYRKSESETKLYLRHSNFVMYVQPSAGWDDGGKGSAVFRENTDNRVVIAKDSSQDIVSIVMTDEQGREFKPGDRLASGARLYVTATPKEGYEVTRIGVGCESNVPDKGYSDIVNGGYLIMPHTDTALKVYTEKFVPQPEAFNHPGVAVSREWLDNMKAHVKAGDELWINEFNLLKSLGEASETPRIYWGGSGSPFGSGYHDLDDSEINQVVLDANTTYVQSLMWYITEKEVYRENALKIFDNYSRINSILVYVKDDRIRVSLAVAKFCIAAEILRYSEFTGPENLKWTDRHTDGFTKYLQLMRPRYDRYGHYMNQHNFCVAATAAAAIFRNDLESYNQAVQRITTNPERCEDGALCDRNALGNDRCFSHANSGDVISQIREVTVNQLTGEPVEPNIQLIELGRDVGHAYCDVGYFSYMAYTALIQGTKVNNDPASEQYGQVSKDPGAVGLFEFADHRILKGANYMVKYTLGYDTLYVPSLVGGDSRSPTIFKQPSDERGGPKNEYWNRFDAVCAGIYNYYRYYDEGKAAVQSGKVQGEDLKYLTEAFIRLYPESLDAANFIGFGSLLYSYTDGVDYDSITEKEYPALQNATVDAAHPDEPFDDDGYLYTGGSFHTYVQFDLSEIEEKDIGELTALGLEVRHSDQDPGQQVKVEFGLYTGDWEQSTATYNSLQSLTEITDVKPPKTLYLRNSFDSKHLLQDVIPKLKEKGYEKVTFRLRQAGAGGTEQPGTTEQPKKAACARVLSISGTDNRHARPRLVTHKLVPITEVPPPDESGYEVPGNRLFTQKTNFKDFGYIAFDNSQEKNDLFTLTKLGDTDVLLRNTQNTPVIYYLGEGDLTDLKKVYYWIGHRSETDVTLYYTRADDDYLKTQQLDFGYDTREGMGVESSSIGVKRYYSARKTMNAFIEQISGNILAAGKTTNNSWSTSSRGELTVSGNAPQGRYKVFMVTTGGDQAYVQFGYETRWDISFSTAAKTAQIAVPAGEEPPTGDDELMVFAAVYAKGGALLKEAEMKKLNVRQGNGRYSIEFGDLSAIGPEEVVKIFMWDEKQRPEIVNQYTVEP